GLAKIHGALKLFERALLGPPDPARSEAPAAGLFFGYPLGVLQKAENSGILRLFELSFQVCEHKRFVEMPREENLLAVVCLARSQLKSFASHQTAARVGEPRPQSRHSLVIASRPSQLVNQHEQLLTKQDSRRPRRPATRRKQ